MNGKIVLRVLISFLLMIFFITILIFTVPQLRESFFWYANQIKTRIDYAINPPEQVVFVPDASQVQPTLPILPFATMTITSTMVVTAETPQVEITATPEPTPMPQAHKLEGITYFDQHGLWNYCAPANLAMQLSYWGWEGKRTDVGKVLKPFEKDKNVMLYEMVDYVNNNTQYHALARYGGSLDLIKKLVANGFPVLVEKGVYLRDINGKLSWMGHYAVIDGYDDLKEEFITQDSFFKPNLPLNYQDLITQWRSFNYYFMVIRKLYCVRPWLNMMTHSMPTRSLIRKRTMKLPPIRGLTFSTPGSTVEPAWCSSRIMPVPPRHTIRRLQPTRPCPKKIALGG